MDVVGQKNRDTVTKQQFMDAMTNYLGNTPFDAERFAIIVQDVLSDEDMDLYIDDILHDYEQGESVDEVEVWSYVFDNHAWVFEDIFSAYYSVGYLNDLITLSEEECEVASQIALILNENTTPWNEIKQRYIAQIQKAFDQYPSSAARQSMTKWAQKMLIAELIKS